MEFKELYLNNELKVDEKCYLNHKEYLYKGLNDEGKHIIELETKDGFERKYVDKTPKVPQLPLNTYVSRNYRGEIQFGEITSCFEMLDDMYYRVDIYSDVFNGHENESYKDLCKRWTVVDENPFMDSEMIEELTEPIDDQIHELEIQIEQLKNNLNELKKERNEITSKCKHKWIKQDEEETSKGRFQQECYCTVCGEEKINYYSRLF